MRSSTPWSSILQAAVSGAAYGLAFPPTSLRPLAWVSLVPLLLALRRASLARAAVLGCVWTLVATWVVGDCLPRAVVNYYHRPYAVGVALLLATTLLTAVPYYTGFAVAYAFVGRRLGRVSPLLTGALWVAAELGRVKGPIGDPWGIAGYSQASALVLSQVADATGVYGLSFLLLAVNGAAADLWASAVRAALPRRTAASGAVVAAAMVLIAAGYGALRIAGEGGAVAVATTDARSSREPEPREGRGAVTAAIVQPDLDVGTRWRADLYGRNLDAYLRMTNDALGAVDARIVFWPEAAMTFFLGDEPSYRKAIGRVLGPYGAELVAGGPRQIGSEDAPTFLNSTFVVQPNGEIAGTYDKEQLLPFAEYFPLNSREIMRRDPGMVREFAPGSPTPPLPTAAGRAGVVVCNEAMFPEPAARRIAAGAEFLVNPSNDSWPDDLKFSLQVFDIVRMRAIEQRRTLVRTSTSGPSAIIDSLGRIRAWAAPNSREWISGPIEPSRRKTIYFYVGDAFAAICLAVSMIAVFRAGLRRPRAAPLRGGESPSPEAAPSPGPG